MTPVFVLLLAIVPLIVAHPIDPEQIIGELMDSQHGEHHHGSRGNYVIFALNLDSHSGHGGSHHGGHDGSHHGGHDGSHHGRDSDSCSSESHEHGHGGHHHHDDVEKDKPEANEIV